MRKLQRRAESWEERYRELVAALGAPGLAERIAAVAPHLAAMLAGVRADGVVALRRNVALHAAADGIRVDTAGAAELRRAQKGPRLGGVAGTPDASEVDANPGERPGSEREPLMVKPFLSVGLPVPVGWLAAGPRLGGALLAAARKAGSALPPEPVGALTLQRVEARLIEDARLAAAGLRMEAAPFVPARAAGSSRRVTVELSSLLRYAPGRKRLAIVEVHPCRRVIELQAQWALEQAAARGKAAPGEVQEVTKYIVVTVPGEYQGDYGEHQGDCDENHGDYGEYQGDYGEYQGDYGEYCEECPEDWFAVEKVVR